MLLVEQPGPWGRNALRESRFDPVVAAALERRADDAGLRVLVIRRPGRSPRGARRTWGIADCRFGHEALHWGHFDQDAELLDLPLDGTAGEPDDAPIFLVCAHSKHDACCALRGRPVAAALHAQRPGRTWECSHVGGERFAANVLVLPLGLLYGRVLPFAAAQFVQAAENGETIGALLRGRIGLPPVAQAALAFAGEHLALRRVDQLQVVGVQRSAEDADHVVVRLATPDQPVEVTVVVERVDAVGLTDANPGPGHYLRYRPVRVCAVE